MPKLYFFLNFAKVDFQKNGYLINTKLLIKNILKAKFYN